MSASSSWLASILTGGTSGGMSTVDRDARTDGLPQEIQHVGNELLNLDGFELELLTARKCQQPLGQRRSALRALHRAFQQSRGSRVVRKSLFQERQAAKMTASRLLKSCATPPVS